MQVVTGAMGSLIPKLFQLLKEEYNLQKGVKQDVEFLVRELPSMHAALRKVADVPRDQLDKQVKLWADQVRELSYVMEDVVDNFLVSVEGFEPAANSHRLKELLKKMGNLIPKGKARRKIANKIKGIKILVKEVADRRDNYKVGDAVANISAARTIDPRLLALFKDQKELAGIGVARDEISKKLADGDGDVPKNQLKILSICGVGGLGKITLAKVVHDGLQENFVLKAFISVGLRPDVKKFLRDILLELDKGTYMSSGSLTLDEKQLIQILQELLLNKRYFIVIDDIWDIETWKIIRCALKDSNCGSRIITTTRNLDVAKKSGEVYQLKPLSRDHSENLFYKRLYGGNRKCPSDQHVETTKKILQKCGGVPLAIITIASLLDGKPREAWSKVYESIGFGIGENHDVDNTRKILLFSYYDMPYYLRPCLLYLSIYPEDFVISDNGLIWKWVAEGFIKDEPGIGQYELGERYFSELVNRSMIQPIEDNYLGIIMGCRVHDLVLDMVRLLSEEENFATVLETNDANISLKSNTRRLSIHKRVMEKDDSMANMCTIQMRSFNVIGCNISVMPSLSSFGALRVLDFDGCHFLGHACPLNHLENLVQLRYLGLRNMRIHQLPDEIGKLKFLQSVDITGSMVEFPQSFGLLRQLKSLCALTNYVKGIAGLHLLGNLTSLEELIFKYYTNSSPEFAAELGKLTELRLLRMGIACEGAHFNDNIVKALVKSLGKLQNLQTLKLFGKVGIGSSDWEGYVPPQKLRELDLEKGGMLLPTWINPSLLPNLTRLLVSVDEVKVRDFDLLGSFPELVSLKLEGSCDSVLDIKAGGLFPKLRYFRTDAPLGFVQGAMPSLEVLVFSIIHVGWLKRRYDNFVFKFDSLGNLPSLERVEATINRRDASQEDVDEAKDALVLATNTHPNHPNLRIKIVNEQLPKLRDDSDQFLPAASHIASGGLPIDCADVSGLQMADGAN